MVLEAKPLAMTAPEENALSSENVSFGHYRVLRTIGSGGMGVVYAAQDDRLGRTVAVKSLRSDSTQSSARERFWVEARAAARVNHPGICQIHDIGEEGGRPYLVMELLDGEPLSTRLARGPVPVSETVDLVAQILDALGALHAEGIVHRDLKPSNVFLTARGGKLLDFGLARSAVPLLETDLALTAAGVLVGTPRYMAPEQWTGEEISPATDIFAVGALFFEMLTGRPAFDGASIFEVHEAVMRGTPPALAGGPEAIGLDQIIRRALERRSRDRFTGAAEMASALRETASPESARPNGFLRATARLVIPPFRVLRHDPETDFLAESIPDALVVSLSKMESLIVRSGHGVPDSSETPANVDLMIRGTIVRAGDEIRITTQLVDFRSGDVARSSESRGVVRELFELQDRICQEILSGLALAPSPTEKLSMRKEEPKNPRAYELYLRANRLAQNRRLWPAALDLYLECVREDPSYAPAWARLGRIHRVLAKYGQADDPARHVQLADQAFRAALDLDPDSSLAHNLYTYFEIEERGAAGDAMIRLLDRARAHPTDAEIFAGLVVACRFCGLLDASVAAHRRGRQIDPGLATSVSFTFWMMGDYEEAIAHDDDEMRFVRHYSLPFLGRTEEAISGLIELERSAVPGLVTEMVVATRSALQGRREECVQVSRKLLTSRFRDPEGLYFAARQLAFVGETELALSVMADVVSRGFVCLPVIKRDPWLDPLRESDRFAAILDTAETEFQITRDRFEQAGGPALLGVSAVTR